MVALWNDIAYPGPPSQGKTRQKGLKLADGVRVKVTGISLQMAFCFLAGDPETLQQGLDF